MWLTGRLAPDFKTIANFQRDNGAAIRAVCSQFVVLCRQLSLFRQATVAIDGSRFKAATMGIATTQNMRRPSGSSRSRPASSATLRAERGTSDVPQARVEQIHEKGAGSRGQMRFLKEVVA